MRRDHIETTSLIHIAITANSECVANIGPTALLLVQVLYLEHGLATAGGWQCHVGLIWVMYDDERCRAIKGETILWRVCSPCAAANYARFHVFAFRGCYKGWGIVEIIKKKKLFNNLPAWMPIFLVNAEIVESSQSVVITLFLVDIILLFSAKTLWKSFWFVLISFPTNSSLLKI